MTNDTIRRLLQAPTTTLAQARRVLDAIKGTLAPAKPDADAEEPLKMFGGKTASEVLRRAAAGESFLDQITCAAGHVPYHKQPGGGTASPAAGGRTAAPAARPAPAPRPAAKPAAAAPRPLASASTAYLAGVAAHPSASLSDAAAARTELATRENVTVLPDGRYSVSSRGGRAVKNAKRA